MTEPVDFVLTWVNEADDSWQQARKKAFESRTGGELVSFDTRFRDWGFLPYWFRSIQTYAPWVNRVHLVHSGAVPKWVNTKHPRLRTWNAEELVGLGYPTFNSHSVESRLHAIPGLAERFVYFNDDTFLTNRITPEFYFKEGLPRLLNAPVLLTKDTEHNHAALHSSGLINDNFTKKQYMKNFMKAIPSLLVDRTRWRPLLHGASRGIPPILNSHVAHPYLKSVVEEAFAAAPEDVEEAREAVFRTREEVSPLYYARMWHLASGNYAPASHKGVGRYYPLSPGRVQAAEQVVLTGKQPQLCLNDKFEGDSSAAQRVILNALEQKFPNKSGFER